MGGKNSAVEAALRCQRAGAEVTLSYRGGEVRKESIKYWLYPELAALTKSGVMAAHWNTVPVRIGATEVVLRRQDGTEYEVPADFVLLMTGYLADMSLAKRAGVELEGEREVPVFNPTSAVRP